MRVNAPGPCFVSADLDFERRLLSICLGLAVRALLVIALLATVILTVAAIPRARLVDVVADGSGADNELRDILRVLR